MACTVFLPSVGFVDSCQTVLKGQVYKLFQTRATVADVLADVTNLVEWTDRIDQTAVIPGSGAAPIRELSGIGSWGERATSDIPIPLDQIYSSPGEKVLSFKVYDLTPLNLAFFVSLEAAGSVQAKIWTQQDSTILGGDAGVNGSMKGGIVVPEGRGDLQYGQITFTTKAAINAIDVTPHPVL